MATTVHHEDLDITKMVLNRLTFLEDTPANQSTISNFIQEVCWELEPCLKIRQYVDATGNTVEETDRVADEQYYKVAQKTLIADLVSLYILMQFATGVNPVSASGGTGGTTSANTYLKKAVAGSVQVEYDIASSGSTSYDKLKIDASVLLTMYKKRVSDKAAMFGCYLSVCEDCMSNNMGTGGLPFIVVSSCNGC